MSSPSLYEVDDEIYETIPEKGEVTSGGEDVVHIYKVSGPLDQQGWRSTMPPRTSVSSNDWVSASAAFQLPAAPRPSRTVAQPSPQELPYQTLTSVGDKDPYQHTAQLLPTAPGLSSDWTPKVLSPVVPIEITAENHYIKLENHF